MTQPNHVFLAWQCATSRKIIPVGRLLCLSRGGYEFSYIRSALRAGEMGFAPLVSFPDLNVVYRSDTLPPLFSNRVMPFTRADFPAFVSELGLDENAGAIQLLSRSGGRRATDELEVFGPPDRGTDGISEIHILVRGVRHVPGAESAISSLNTGERLLVLRDEQNAHGAHAKLLRTDRTELVGFLPDYLAQELDRRRDPGLEGLIVTVEKVNLAPAPVHHRLLCRVRFPTAEGLFEGPDYEPIAKDAATAA